MINRLGVTLKEEIDRLGNLPISDCLEVLRDVAQALEGMLEVGHSHNDVKPENILRGPQGWTLIDPCPESVCTPSFKDEDIQEEEPDVFTLGISCQVAMKGMKGYKDMTLNPAFFIQLAKINEDFAKLFRRLLKDGRCKVPSASKVRRSARKLLESFQ